MTKGDASISMWPASRILGRLTLCRVRSRDGYGTTTRAPLPPCDHNDRAEALGRSRRVSRTVYEQIKASGGLPSPTGVALRILELTQDEATTVNQITAAVEKDPALASRLLKLVNSPLAGLPRQIGSVSRAVALIGSRTVSTMALGFCLISNNRNGNCPGFDYDMFWSDSLARAVVARHVATRVKDFAPDETFTCGLLCQIGRLALACAFPDRYADVLTVIASEDTNELAEIERELFGLDHAELAAEMMGDWHMPAIFRSAVRAQLAPNASDLSPDSREHLMARILHFGGSVSLILTRPTVCRETFSDVLLEANRLGIAPDVYHDAFDALSREWRDAGAILTVQTRHVPPLGEMYAQARSRLVALEAGSGKPAGTMDSNGGRDARD